MRSSRISKGLLLLLLLASGLTRTYVWASTTTLFENEGAEYTRLAESLASGYGYNGTMDGPRFWYGPLYPLLICGVSFVVRNFELSAYLASLLFGTLLTVPVFLIVLSLYGEFTALVCATLVAFHPVLVVYSAAAFNENVYLPLLMFGIYWGLAAIRDEKLLPYLLAGVCFGLAYLARVEVILFPFLVAAFGFLTSYFRGVRIGKALWRPLATVPAFLVVAAPYIAFLSFETGKLRVEAKNLLNYTVARRLESGMPYHQAAWGVEADLKETGPLLNPRYYANYTPYPPSFSSLLGYIGNAAVRNAKPVTQGLVYLMGSPIPVGLVLIGLFRKPWDWSRLFDEVYLGSVLLVLLFPLLGAHLLQTRYMLAVIPALSLWVGKGVVEFSEWVKDTAHGIGLGSISGQMLSRMVAVLVLMLALIPAIRVVPYLSEVTQTRLSHLPLKQAGAWLKQHHPGPKKIIDTESAVVAYYSGGYYWSLPYAEPRVALRYIESKNPDFVVLNGRLMGLRPYLRSWIEEGIPHPAARLVYSSGETLEERILIYQWAAAVPRIPLR